MSTQPEALRLAGVLEAMNGAKKLLPCVGGQTLGTEVYQIRLSGADAGELLEAADELRRQHAEIERLRIEKARWETAVLNCVAMSNGREDEWGSRAEWAFGFLHAAIAKAEEVTP